MTFGMDLMNQIHSGEIKTASLKTVTKVREQVSSALEEILEVGARIRPLLMDGKQIGWVRGIHLSERRIINRWYADPSDRIAHILRLSTTLPDSFLNDLDTYEFRTLIRQVTTYSDADITLFPYISAFVTTSTSETLWASQGTSLTVNKKEPVDLLDGTSMKILVAPDHARLWATLAAHRERAKIKLDDMFNAALIVKSMVGKGANNLFNDLQKSVKRMTPDNDDPWKEIVPAVTEDIKFDDGWGHAHDDDSESGFWRESQGLLNNDKHEQFMDKFYQEQMEAAQKQEADLEKRFQESSDWGGVSDAMTILTPAEIRRREVAARQQERNTLPSADLTGEESAEDLISKHMIRGRGF